MTSWSIRGFLKARGVLFALQRGLKTISIAPKKCGNFKTSNQFNCGVKPAWCCGQSGFGWFLKEPHLCAWIPHITSSPAARLRACVRARARLLSAGAPRVSECGVTPGIRARTRFGKRTWMPPACVSLSPARRAKTDAFPISDPSAGCVSRARSGHTSI